MSREPIEPVFSSEDGDVTIYGTVSDLENHIEPPDVDTVEAFDARARRIRLTTDGRQTFAELTEIEPSSAAHFEDILRRNLSWRGEEAASQAELEELIEMARRHIDVPSARKGLWRRRT
jgi:hypothetical protein